VTSALSVVNNGTGPAFVVNQKGVQPVANFQDDGASALYIEDGGDVGLGTTSPVSKLTIGIGTNTYPTTPADSYDNAITLNGGSLARLVMNDGTGNFQQYLNSYYDSTAAAHKYTAAAVQANRFTISAGTYGFYVAPASVAAGDNITWTTAMYIDNNGNTGIGTISPAAKLEVSNGTVNFQVAPDTATSRVVIGPSTNHSLAFQTNAATAMTIDTSGNVSINGNSTLGNVNTDTTIIRGIAKIADSSATNGILFGTGDASYDTNIYRSAANSLKTDDSLTVDINLNVNGNSTLGNVNTDTTIIRGIAKIADSSATNGILFGTGDANYDTNLYRDSANNLKTDDNLTVAGTTTLNQTLTLADAVNIVLNTSTGTKIGTATTQKLGFYNATPVVQPTAVANATGTLADVVTQFNALLVKLRTLGLIAT